MWAILRKSSVMVYATLCNTNNVCQDVAAITFTEIPVDHFLIILLNPILSTISLYWWCSKIFIIWRKYHNISWRVWYGTTLVAAYDFWKEAFVVCMFLCDNSSKLNAWQVKLLLHWNGLIQPDILGFLGRESLAELPPDLLTFSHIRYQL